MAFMVDMTGGEPKRRIIGFLVAICASGIRLWE
jgi:hypothetical protein